MGLNKVMLDCDVNNLESSKTIQALVGILERTGVDPYDGLLTSVYFIDINDAINRYKDMYENYIYKSNNPSIK